MKIVRKRLALVPWHIQRKCNNYTNTTAHSKQQNILTDPTAANEIKQRTARRIIETAVDDVCAEQAEALLLRHRKASDGDFAGDDEGDEGAVAVKVVGGGGV